jgi:hypothetical protein
VVGRAGLTPRLEPEPAAADNPFVEPPASTAESAAAPPPGQAGPPGPAPRRRRAGGRAVLAVVVVLALGLGLAAVREPATWPWERRAAAAPAPPAPAPPTDRPAPDADVALSPLGEPLAAPVDGGPYRFADVQDDGVTPVAYDPCRPVHYVTRPDHAPPAGAEIVASALARVSEVTGLRFVDDGTTDERSDAERAPFQRDRYGDRWAPVLISWDTEEENPDLAGDLVGEGGSIAVSLGEGPKVYVTGIVSLDATQLPGILGQPDGAAAVHGIVLHELGHLLGLDHVDDAAQLMYPEARRAVGDFASGDLTGLAALSRGVCVPEL